MSGLVAELAALRTRAGVGSLSLSGVTAGSVSSPTSARSRESAGAEGPVELQVRGADFDRLLDLQQRLSELDDVTRVVLTGVEHGKATLLLEMGQPATRNESPPPGGHALSESEPTLVCAWCDAVLSVGGPQVSHGLCAACARPFMLGNRQ